AGADRAGPAAPLFARRVVAGGAPRPSALVGRSRGSPRAASPRPTRGRFPHQPPRPSSESAARPPPPSPPPPRFSPPTLPAARCGPGERAAPAPCAHLWGLDAGPGRRQGGGAATLSVAGASQSLVRRRPACPRRDAPGTAPAVATRPGVG